MSKLEEMGARYRSVKIFTFGDFDTLDGFVVYRSGTLFDEFISFNTDIEYFGSTHAEWDELLDRDIDDIRGSLQKPNERIKKVMDRKNRQLHPINEKNDEKNKSL